MIMSMILFTESLCLIDFYILKFEPEVQRRLMEIRFTAFDTLKGAEERIYHGIPTYNFSSLFILIYKII